MLHVLIMTDDVQLPNDSAMLWTLHVSDNRGGMGRITVCSRSYFYYQSKIFSWQCRRCLSVAVADESHETRSNSSTQNVKPFKDIPGPKGLPYLGTILQYRKGIQMDQTKQNSWLFFNWKCLILRLMSLKNNKSSRPREGDKIKTINIFTQII